MEVFREVREEGRGKRGEGRGEKKREKVEREEGRGKRGEGLKRGSGGRGTGGRGKRGEGPRGDIVIPVINILEFITFNSY